MVSNGHTTDGSTVIAFEHVTKQFKKTMAGEHTIVISSHLLHDIEPIVNRIVCLDRGVVTINDELDTLKEAYAEWIVSARSATLPTSWTNPLVVRASGDATAARLMVRGTPESRRVLMAQLMSDYSAEVQPRALNLEELFPLLTSGVHATR